MDDKYTDNPRDIKHGVDGWGLEIYSRDESRAEDGTVTVFGEYLYERTVNGRTEKAQVTRVLETRKMA